LLRLWPGAERHDIEPGQLKRDEADKGVWQP
jgi:hypothetical protein